MLDWPQVGRKLALHRQMGWPVRRGLLPIDWLLGSSTIIFLFSVTILIPHSDRPMMTQFNSPFACFQPAPSQPNRPIASRWLLSRSGQRQNWLLLLLIGSSLCLLPRPGWAETAPAGRQLLAQQVVDGLPPPPSVTFGEQPLPLPANQSSQIQPAASTPEQRYQVYVNGDSPLLLEQVRRIEPGAFLQTVEGRQVIQAGLFDQPDGAEGQVAVLAAQGIGAEVVTVPGVPLGASVPQTASYGMTGTQPLPQLVPTAPSSREIEFGQQPSGSQPAQAAAPASQDSPYYVVIPGSRATLASVGQQVQLLSAGLNLQTGVVQPSQSPRGSHIQVGPFINRSAAERWNRYFRDFGMDARVYYQR